MLTFISFDNAILIFNEKIRIFFLNFRSFKNNYLILVLLIKILFHVYLLMQFESIFLNYTKNKAINFCLGKGVSFAKQRAKYVAGEKY